MKFAHPAWLLLGIVVPLLAGGYLWSLRRSRKRALRFANLDLLERVAPARPTRWRHSAIAVVLVGIALLVVAAAGPTATVKEPRNRATVMLAIDVSLSMMAEDVEPDRLTAAKAAATEFVENLTPGVNLGLVSFAGLSTVLATPTTQREPVIKAIQALQLDERTATGEAVISSLQTIELFSSTIATVDGDDEQIPARIVLMTDGQRTVGRTEEEAATLAKEAGVPVSVIAFGTDNASIEINGTRQEVNLDTEAMQEIAEISGGDFHLAASAEDLEAVYAQLGEQIGYEEKEQDVSRPWLIAGTLAVVLGAAVGLALGARIP